MISIALSNRDCIFDSSEFPTLEEALTFARGRGGIYVVQLSRGEDPGAVLSYDSDADEFSRFDGWEWHTIPTADIASYICPLAVPLPPCGVTQPDHFNRPSVGIVRGQKGIDMERIDICTILINESDTERQTISYEPETRMLYTDAPGFEGPVDEVKYDTIQEAEDACNAMWGWGGCAVWDLQWIDRDE